MTSNDFEEYAERLEAEIKQTAETIGLNLDGIDLLIDLGDIGQAQFGTVALGARAVLSVLPDLRTYRTVTLAATSFPKDLSRVQSFSITAYVCF